MSYDLSKTETLRHGVDYYCGLSGGEAIYLYPQEDGKGPRLPPEMSVGQVRVLIEKLTHLVEIVDSREVAA